MKKLIRYAGFLLLAVFVGISAYYILEVRQARQYTNEVVLEDLKENCWRKPNGTIHAFEISNHDLSKQQIDILLKVQDPAFYEHQGIDLSTPGAGLTTITQAITKTLYFNNFKPGLAKIKQSLIARFVVDDLIPKNDQLTLFINMIYFGNVNQNPVFGLKAAAEAYYGKPVQELTEEQYISLIAMIICPKTFHLVNHSDWNRDRANRIKTLVAGEYKPNGLMDQYYGELPQEIIDYGLPPASYFGDAEENVE